MQQIADGRPPLSPGGYVKIPYNARRNADAWGEKSPGEPRRVAAGEFQSRHVDSEAVAEWFRNLPEPLSESLSRYQRRMADYLLETGRLDGLQNLERSGTLPVTALKYFQRALDLYDEAVQLFLGYLRRSGMDVQCRAGCPHCCYHMPTGVSSMELLYLYFGMQRSGSPGRLFRRCLEAEEVWFGIYRQIGADPSIRDPRSALLTRYHQEQRPCPFLEEDRCLVYPYRPFACRMHFSLSPRYWCHPCRAQNSETLQFNVEPGPCVLDALERIEDRMQLAVSDVMVCGMLELTVNILHFESLAWS